MQQLAFYYESIFVEIVFKSETETFLSLPNVPSIVTLNDVNKNFVS